MNVLVDLFRLLFVAEPPAKPLPKKKKGKRRVAIPKKLREEVWYEYHGERMTGVCYTCGDGIRKDKAGWHCGHVLSQAEGGTNTLKNLRTLCAGCNLSMGKMNLYVFIKKNNLKGPGSKAICH